MEEQIMQQNPHPCSRSWRVRDNSATRREENDMGMPEAAAYIIKCSTFGTANSANSPVHHTPEVVKEEIVAVNRNCNNEHPDVEARAPYENDRLYAGVQTQPQNKQGTPYAATLPACFHSFFLLLLCCFCLSFRHPV